MAFCKVHFAKYAKKHIKKFAYIKKKQYLCTGFEKITKWYMVNDQMVNEIDQSFLYLK
jgi:hypothetical protein